MQVKPLQCECEDFEEVLEPMSLLVDIPCLSLASVTFQLASPKGLTQVSLEAVRCSCV